jgi:GNAT superfamily N-acetyltransferase
MTMLTLRPVRTANDRREFARAARELYPPESPWVRPLDSVIRDYLHPTRNPFFRDGAGQAFLATRDGRTVGRVLAHVWDRYARLHGERAGFFGFFECEDNQETASALLTAATDFAQSHRTTVLRGPFDMTAAQEIGVVTSGFDAVPAIDMVYTPPWHPVLYEAAGFRRCLEMTTWLNPNIRGLNAEAIMPRERRVKLEALGVTVRPIRRWQRNADMEFVRELTNAGFLGNWGFVPISRPEWELQVGALLPLLDPNLILLAELHGVPIGVTFAVPDFNRILRTMNGSLFTPKVVNLLRRATDAAVVILFAVRKQHQGLGVSRLLNAELIRALQRGGYRSLAIAWVASGNRASRAQTAALGMSPLHQLAMVEKEV